MKRTISVVLVVLLVWSARSLAAETRAKVVGQRINLRAKPDPESEVVGQLSDGDLLNVKSFQGDWVEIVPPGSVDLWIHRDFLVDNTVSAAKLYVRSGPGINYNGVGMLVKGNTVSPRGEFGEWVKIAPPPVCSLWVSRGYVQVLEPEKARPPAPEVAERRREVLPPETSPAQPVAAPEPAAARASPAPAAEPPAASPPANMQLIPLEGQGRSVQRDGELRPVGFLFKRPARYKLVRGDGAADTICYVHGNHAQLAAYVNQRLLIRGREYWIRGVRYPVVVPEQIIPRAGQ